jgi:hypothetical protein
MKTHSVYIIIALAILFLGSPIHPARPAQKETARIENHFITSAPEPVGFETLLPNGTKPYASAGLLDASTVGPLPSTLMVILLGIITLVLTRHRE